MRWVLISSNYCLSVCWGTKRTSYWIYSTSKPVYRSGMIGCIIIRRFAPWRRDVSPSQINNGLCATRWNTVLKLHGFYSCEFVFLSWGLHNCIFTKLSMGLEGTEESLRNYVSDVSLCYETLGGDEATHLERETHKSLCRRVDETINTAQCKQYLNISV